MKNLSRLLWLSCLLFYSSCHGTKKNIQITGVEELLGCKNNLKPFSDLALEKIAFGSCQSQDKPILALNRIIKESPDLFIYLGDNIYGDTEDMKVLATKYSKLCARGSFIKLTQTCPVIATWDDHDYGANDAGREYSQKENSKKLFLEFWNEPKDSERYKRKGVYTSYTIGPEGKKTQIILLDTRTFRSPLLSAKGKEFRNDYRTNFDQSATILGEEQWNWLAQELEKPADLRIIGSSTQFAVEYNGYEAWANFPKEQEKMFKLIKDKRAEHLVFISGDVHYGELSKIEVENLYPIYDLTSSGLNMDWPHMEPNKYRQGKGCDLYNYGKIEINWKKKSIDFVLTTAFGKEHNRNSIFFQELEFEQ